MNDKKKTQNAFLEAISVMIDKKIKNLGFNYYVDGVIKNKNDNNTYNVLINNVTYSNIPSKNNFEYLVGDTVQVLVKNGNWNKKIIDDKVGHNKVPQNILNLENDIENIQNSVENIENTYSNFGQCIKIEPNSDLNDYKTVGSYAIYSTVDTKSINNVPCELAGKLDIYASNGNKNSSDYIYLIQEYTSFNGQKRYYRYIQKDGANAEWVYTEWFEKLSTNNVQDYIVEQGITESGWAYEKYYSGVMKQWMIISPQFTSWVKWVNDYWYYGSPYVTISFGIPFTAQPIVNATNLSSSWAIPLIQGVTNTKFDISGVRPNAGHTSANAYYYSIFAVGRWK